MTPLRRTASLEDEDRFAGGTWVPADLRTVVGGLVDGTIGRPAPSVGRRSDGAFLLYRGRVNAFISESGGAKTWVALEVCRQELELGRGVVFVDFEDQAAGICRRLLDLGGRPAGITSRFRYLSPDEPFSPGAERRVIDLLADTRPSLVVIDSVGESMALDGVRPNDDDQVAGWYRRLPRRLAGFGPAVICLDHLTKSPDGRGLYAIGSQRKRAAVSGAAYLLETVEEFGQGRVGSTRLVVAKDRHGTYSKGQTAARFVLGPARTGSAGDGVEGRLDVPEPGRSQAPAFRPTRLMELVSRYVEAHPGASGNDLDKARLGKADYVRKATAVLAAEGWLRAERVGPALRHHCERPFREGADTATCELQHP